MMLKNYFLLYRAQNGHLNLVDFLIEKNANVDAYYGDGKTPLSIASQVCLLSFNS